MTDFDETILTAAQAARQMAESQEALDRALEVLKPIAKDQLAIMRKVLKELNLEESSYESRQIMRCSWVELEVQNYYWTDEMPSIQAVMWQRGYCGDPDSEEGSFMVSKHMLDGKPELFEAEYRAKLKVEADKKARQVELDRLKRIQQLEADLKKMKEQK